MRWSEWGDGVVPSTVKWARTQDNERIWSFWTPREEHRLALYPIIPYQIEVAEHDETIKTRWKIEQREGEHKYEGSIGSKYSSGVSELLILFTTSRP